MVGGLVGGDVAMFPILGFGSERRPRKGNWYQLRSIQALKSKNRQPRWRGYGDFYRLKRQTTASDLHVVDHDLAKA